MKRLAAEISVQHGIRVDADDPIMAVVTLNRLVLEQAVTEILEEVRAATREFELAARGLQARAGGVLAQEVREYAAGIKQQLATEIDAAGVRAREIVAAVSHSHAKSAFRTWVAAGLLSAVLLFGCGVWLGVLLR
jgi:hypothetical protein